MDIGLTSLNTIFSSPTRAYMDTWITGVGHGDMHNLITLPLTLAYLIGEGKSLFVSNLSMNGWSAPWYMPLTMFETVFLCLIMFKIIVLRWIEILPININNLFHGDPSGKRRKRSVTLTLPHSHLDDPIIYQFLQLLERTDRERCFLRSICLISQTEESTTIKNVLEIHDLISMLHSLKSFGYVLSVGHSNNTSVGDHDEYLNGLRNAIGDDNSNCEDDYYYGQCTSTSKNELIDYFKFISTTVS